jgi:hypothetical protein
MCNVIESELICGYLVITYLIVSYELSAYCYADQYSSQKEILVYERIGLLV